METLNELIVNENLHHFFNNFKSAAKVNLVFGFVLKNTEDGGFRYFDMHEDNTLLYRSKLVCTRDDLAELKNFLNLADVIVCCSRKNRVQSRNSTN